MHIIRAIVSGAGSTQHFAHAAVAALFLLFGQRCIQNGFPEVNAGKRIRERFDVREQYGNNLGRKPSQMIPNDPKSALTSIGSADFRALSSIGRGPEKAGVGG